MEYGRLIKNCANGTFLKDTSGDGLGDGWGTSDLVASKSMANGIQTFKVGQAYAGIIVSSSQYTIIPGHTYYGKADVKSPAGYNTAKLMCYNVNGGASVAFTGSGNFQTKSVLFTANAGSTSFKIQDEASSGWQDIQVRKVVLIDLTGTPYASYSKADLDIIFANANGGPLIQPANPIWIEENTTNLLQKPLDFSDAIWGKQAGLILSKATTVKDPFGQYNAWLIEDDSTTINRYLEQYLTVANDSVTRNFSVYLKQDTAPSTQISMVYSQGTNVSAYCWIDWTAKTVSSDATLTPVGDGWYKFVLALANNSSGNTRLYFAIYPAGYIAGGTTAGKVYVAYPQIEEKAYATNFVEGARAVEVCKIAANGISTDAVCIRGWLYITEAARGRRRWARVFEILKSPSGYGFFLMKYSSTDDWGMAFVNDAGTATYAPSINNTHPGVSVGWHWMAVKISKTEAKWLIDGIPVSTQVNPGLPTSFLPYVYAGSSSNGSNSIGILWDEIHITNDYPSDATLLNEYLNNYPAVPERQSTNICPTDVTAWEQGSFDGGTGLPASSTTRIRTASYINVISNTQYSLSSISGYNAAIFLYDANSVYVGYYVATAGDPALVATPRTFLTPSNCSKVKLLIANTANTSITPTEIPTIKPQIELGSTHTSWMANPIKNLCPTAESGWVIGGINSSGNNYSSTTILRLINYLTVDPTKQYTVSAGNGYNVRVHYYDTNNVFLSNSGVSATSVTFIPPTNCVKIRVTVSNGGGTDIALNEITAAQPQAEYGAARTTWLPYNTPVNTTRQVTLIRPKVKYVNQG